MGRAFAMCVMDGDRLIVEKALKNLILSTTWTRMILLKTQPPFGLLCEPASDPAHSSALARSRNFTSQGRRMVAMAPSTLHELDAGDMQALLSVQATTSEQLVTACYERISARDDAVGAFTHLNLSVALSAAKAADATRKQLGADASSSPLLLGVPFAAKDIINTACFPTEYGSPIFFRDQSLNQVMKRDSLPPRVPVGPLQGNAAVLLAAGCWSIFRYRRQACAFSLCTARIQTARI